MRPSCSRRLPIARRSARRFDDPAHMAIMASQPIDFRRQRRAAIARAPILVVVGANNIDPSLMKAAGLDPAGDRRPGPAAWASFVKPPKDDALSRYEAATARGQSSNATSRPPAAWPNARAVSTRRRNTGVVAHDVDSTTSIQQKQKQMRAMYENQRFALGRSLAGGRAAKVKRTASSALLMNGIRGRSRSIATTIRGAFASAKTLGDGARSIGRRMVRRHRSSVRSDRRSPRAPRDRRRRHAGRQRRRHGP